MRTLRLQLRPSARTIFGVLNVVPLPGLGAILAGWRNPHSRLLPRGAAQMVLVVLGSYPLVVPGAVGLGWALLDGVRILQSDLLPLPVGLPEPNPGNG